MYESIANNNQYIFAGFWKRIAAAIIDTFILGFITGVLDAIFLSELPPDEFKIFFILLNLLYSIVYYAGFESSEWQATPGKRIYNFKIIGVNGERISFLRATVRNLCIPFSIIVFMLGVISMYTHRFKQGWHDQIVNTYVIVV